MFSKERGVPALLFSVCAFCAKPEVCWDTNHAVSSEGRLLQLPVRSLPILDLIFPLPHTERRRSSETFGDKQTSLHGFLAWQNRVEPSLTSL
jgi:hypothetical protein